MRSPMKSMLKVFLVAFLALSGPAQAGTVTITLGSGLTQDGFLTTNATFGNVWDSYTRTVQCILVGTDTPGGSGAVYRAYMRFPLSGITGHVVKATINTYLYEKNSAAYNAYLDECISDFETLSWGGSTDSPDWSYSHSAGVGIVTPSDALGWKSYDFTTKVNAAIDAAKTHFAVNWRYGSEGTITLNHFYSFVSGDAGSLRPYLEVIELTAPSDVVVLFTPTGAAKISWTGTTSDEEDGFKIERSPDGGSTWIQIATVGAGVNTYTDVPRPGYNIYRVRAYESTYNSGYATWAGTMGRMIP